MKDRNQHMTIEETNNQMLADLTFEIGELKKKTTLIQICLWLSIIINAILAIIMPDMVINKLRLSIFF